MRFTRNKKPDTRNLISTILRPLLRFWVRGSAPKQQGTVLIPGLEQKVQVFWDPHAIPHLFAASERDLFMAQGYLHAQERLWQMDIGRRFLCGRLAEILGSGPVPWQELSIRLQDRTTVDLDFFMRLIGIRRSARASLGLLPEELVDRLSAYSQGVNRYIESHINRLPLEFRLLRYQPEPWHPEDSLTIGKGFALFLSTALSTRLTWSAVTERLRGQDAKLNYLAPANRGEGFAITRSVADQAGQIVRFINGAFRQSDWAASGTGSNNWVIAPSRSSTGKAILCNDPHLRMTLPSVWYLMHLQAAPDSGEGEPFEVWGASIPGSPFINIGHNRQIAWGVTAGLCDDGELYREKLHPDEPDLYLAGNQWTRMAVVEETLRVRGRKEVKRRVRSTRHGPVISDFTQEISGPTDEVLAFKWTAHEPSEEVRCVYGVNRARAWDEFRASLSYQTAPTLNYVYADAGGNIGYSLAGKIPVRPHGPSPLPVPGWDESFEWRGYVPFDELPHLYNPPEGVIATANNQIAEDSYPYYLSFLFEPPYRVRRIKELLTTKEKFSPEEMAQIQKDVVSLHGRETVKILEADLQEIARKEPPLQEVAQRLARWQGDCSEKSPEAALFHLFHQRLMVNLLKPDLGQELCQAYLELFNQPLRPIEMILRDTGSPWFSSRPRQEWVEQSLREAQQELVERLGRNMESWDWGTLHTLTLTHPFGRVKMLAPLLSIGPFPTAGDGVTINMGFYSYEHPYRYAVGPSLRMIVDLADWRHSRFVLPSGQSGHCFSPHYRDQTELWRRGEHIQLPCDEEIMKRWPLLILAPTI